MKILSLFLIILFTPFMCEEEKELPVSDKVKLEFRLAQDDQADSLEVRILNGDTLYLHEKIELSNPDIALVAKTELNDGIVLIFSNQGNEKISRLSVSGFGKFLAIIVNDKILIAPKIMGKVSGKVKITGNFTEEGINELFDALTGDIEDINIDNKRR